MDVRLTTDETYVLKKAVNTFGIKNQEDIAIEEMSELTKAIIKNRRYGTLETKENLLEEIIDVQIMLIQLVYYYGLPEGVLPKKINRLKQRMEGDKK